MLNLIRPVTEGKDTTATSVVTRDELLEICSRIEDNKAQNLYDIKWLQTSDEI